MCIYIYTQISIILYTHICMCIILVGGLEHVLPFIGNNYHPNLFWYFSEGLKPPTRIYIYICIYVYIRISHSSVEKSMDFLSGWSCWTPWWCAMAELKSGTSCIGRLLWHGDGFIPRNYECGHSLFLEYVLYIIHLSIHLRDRCPGWSRQPGPNHHPQPIGYPANQWPKMYRSHDNLELGGVVVVLYLMIFIYKSGW